jgi:hypothetical protein
MYGHFQRAAIQQVDSNAGHGRSSLLRCNERKIQLRLRLGARARLVEGFSCARATLPPGGNSMPI